ncbi:MAG TPA: bifunctional diguanylate cyclase/phosphodiesterase [Candidatus Dormibacteraeota bacterium]|nr:bifunctional diguanylate cyclase/phosphodiesterase [Candidatus Dormibacteraeota bacterium]
MITRSSAPPSPSLERAALETVIARVRWFGVALGLAEAFLTDPPPISRAGCVAATVLLALSNLLAARVRHLPARAVEPAVALTFAIDHLVCTGWVALMANDRYSSSYVLFTLVGIEAAVLYRWRGTVVFSGAFLASAAALAWERASGIGLQPESGSLLLRVSVVLMLCAFAGAIAEQSHRRQRALDEAARRSQALYQVTSLVARARDREEALAALGAAAMAIGPRRWHALVLPGPDGALQVAHVHGLPAGVSLPLPPAGDLEALRSPRIAADLAADPAPWPGWAPPPGLDRHRSAVLLPIATHDTWFGALIALDPEPNGFGAEDVEFLAALAGEAAGLLERSRLVDRLEQLASTDALTGLRNRREFERVLERTAGDHVAVLAIDVDNLKPINDEFGHEAGDAVLRAVARALSSLLREWDVVARVGGDEFAALLIGATAAEALGVAERVRAAMHGVAVPQGQARISVGCASGRAGADVHDVWQLADAALFRAKRSGRDRAVAAGDDDQWREGAEWSAVLPSLLARRTVRAVYQPIVRLDDGSLVGYEALARPGAHPTAASVEALFTAAHRLGVARDLDWLCRRTAVQDAHHIPAGIPVFVNVGVGALLDPVHDVDQMLLLLRFAGRAPQDVVLEITERETITDLDRLRLVLQRYRAEGFRIAIDDVGEGRCTLEVLATALPEYLKLARSLIVSAGAPGPRSAIEAAVAFARSSGATVIAEGVENAAVAQRMRALGISVGQGWHLGAPMEAGDVGEASGAAASYTAAG